MKDFSLLSFSREVKIVKDQLSLEIFIPGINSGAYDKELYFRLRVWKKRWFGKRFAFGEMRLSIPEIKDLRDECDKVIEYATSK